MELLLVKLAVTMVAVVGLTLVAERISARAAGILAGFPHGIAIVLYFIGVEQGAEFAARAAGFATAGLAGNVVLAWIYARLAMRLGRGIGAVAGAALGGVAAFLAVAGGLKLISPGPLLAPLITLAAIVLVWLLVRREFGQEAARPPVRVSELLVRAAIAGAIVVLITGLAGLLGSTWAGLLAGFPVVTFPVLVIMHWRHGPAPVAGIVRHYPFGIMALLIYTLVASRSFSALGMGWGTLVALAAAAGWLALASSLKARRG